MNINSKGICTTAMLAMLMALMGAPFVYRIAQSQHWFSLYSTLSRKTAHESFETERLTAHRITVQDLNNLHLLLSLPQVGLMRVHSRKEAKKKLQACLRHWKEYEFGSWIFYDKKTGKFIGIGDLCPAPGTAISSNNETIFHSGEVMISYVIMPEYWNKGFATEIAQALIKLGFEKLDLESIIGFTDLSNTYSRRILEKAGFVCQEFPAIALYRLTKKQYCLQSHYQ